MTLLSAVNDAQRLLSLAVTSGVISDGQETQNLLYGLARMEALEIMRRTEYEFAALRSEHTFTATTSATLQASGKPSDLKRVTPDTLWNRTADRKVQGPISSEEWAIAKGVPVTTGITQFAMLRADGLHIWPAPTAADTIAYEYISSMPVESSGGSSKANFDTDTDVYKLGDELLILALVWRYKQAKGRNYAEDLKTYEMALASLSVASTGARAVMIAPPDVDELGFGVIPETGFGP